LNTKILTFQVWPEELEFEKFKFGHLFHTCKKEKRGVEYQFETRGVEKQGQARGTRSNKIMGVAEKVPEQRG
jgi:hypothetical protein